jgi:F0F1-type ATP synthase assembly protein I
MKNILPPESGKYLGVGVQLAAGFLLGMLLGYWADKHWQKFPLWTLAGAGVGTVAGFYNLYAQLTKRD